MQETTTLGQFKTNASSATWWSNLKSMQIALPGGKKLKLPQVAPPCNWWPNLEPMQLTPPDKTLEVDQSQDIDSVSPVFSSAGFNFCCRDISRYAVNIHGLTQELSLSREFYHHHQPLAV